jgi:hypothetical protein
LFGSKSRIVNDTLKGHVQAIAKLGRMGFTITDKEQGEPSLPSLISELTAKSYVAQLLIKFCTSTDKMLPSLVKMIVGIGSSWPS